MTSLSILWFGTLFFSGMFAQAFILLAPQWTAGDLKKVLASFGFGLFGMIPGKREMEYSLGFHLLLSFLFASTYFAATFRKRLLARIGARSLIVLNLLLVVLTFNHFGFLWVTGLLAFPTLLTLINGFTDIDRHFVWQVFFYIWFTIMTVAFGFFYFKFGDFWGAINIFGQGQTIEVSAWSAVLQGTAFLNILTSAWYIVNLIPTTSKHQTFEARTEEVREHMELLAYGYLWRKGDKIGNTLCLLIFSTLLFLNYRFNFLQEGTLVFLVLTLIPFVGRFERSGDKAHDGIGEMGNTDITQLN